MFSSAKILFLNLLFLALSSSLLAQDYNPATNQKDSFSVALVTLLNCATTRFQDCKGDSIRTTSLLGTDYKLAIHFPNSIAAIVRTGDWDNNVYIEFRGYADKKARNEGIKELILKIKNALGNQLYDYNEQKNISEVSFYGLSVKDKNGFFSMNMELFASTSSAPIYLLSSEKEDEREVESHFIILKIYGGTPAYQYYINDVLPPDKNVHMVLTKLLNDAKSDFNTLKKPKGIDTLHIGFDVIMKYRRANYSANLLFPSSDDSVAFNKTWNYYQQVVQAALGNDYVYHLYSLQNQPFVVYYKMENNNNTPRIYLSVERENNKAPFINIEIQSGYTHPTKRGLTKEDFD